MKVFDLHSDLFTDIAFRRSKGERNVFDRIHYPKLKKGCVDAVICVFWVEPAFRDNPYERFRMLRESVLDDLRTAQHVNLCTTTKDFVDAQKVGKINVLLGLEGLTFMEHWGEASIQGNVESAFHELHEGGVRHAIYAWNENNFLASGTGAYNERIHTGLTQYGRQATKLANDYRWLLDASHLDEPSFWNLYEASERPIIASHSNARALCDHERNVTDEQIKAIASKGGIIGLNAHYAFIDKVNPTVDTFIDHAVYMADLVGPEHVAFGFDFLDFLDGHQLGSDVEEGTTVGLECVEKVPELLMKMEQRGFSRKEVERISYTNAFDFISKQLKG